MPTERTLYVVVHGVGDPEPGETTRDLARGLTAARQHGEVVAVTEERLLVPEPDPAGGSPPRLARAFVVPVFRNDARGRLLAEVNWADLSRLPVSLFGLFEGVVGLLFGLRHVAAAASSHCEYKPAATLRWVGRAVPFLLIGPLAASNVLMIFLLGAAVVADRLAPGSFGGAVGEPLARVFSVLAVVVGAGLGWLLRRHEVYRWLFFSLACVAVLVLAAGLTLQISGRSNVLWQAPGMGVLRTALQAKPADGHPTADSTGGVVYFAAVAVIPMAFAFVGAAVLAFVAFAVYAGFLASRPAPNARRSALVATLLPFAMLFGWCVLIPFAWVISGVVVSSQSWLSEDFKVVYHTLLDFLLADLPLFYAGLGLVVLAAFAALYSWWRNTAVDSEDKRLIVASLVLLALAANAVLLPAAVVLGLACGGKYPDFHLGTVAKTAVKVVAVGLPFAPLVLKVIFPRLRNVLDLVFDVATHFRPRSDNSPDSPDEYPIRAAIQRRVARVVEYFSDQAAAAKAANGEDWNIVIVCHSQGTMAVLEYLNDAASPAVLKSFQSLRLVTMGSPFTHIYQHYFHHLYPSLADPKRWGTLQENVGARDGNRWLNVYRVDDYVGRRIEETGLVENKKVEHYGHTNYWSDGVVMGVLVREGVFRGGP